MSGPVEIVVILAALCYLLVRRLLGEPAEARRMLLLPAVLTVIGLTDVSHDVKSVVPLLFLLGSGGLSVLIGALRGLSVRVSERQGVAFVQYRWVTVALWAVNLAIKFGGNVVLRTADPHAALAVSNSLLLTLGAGILAEGLVVMARAMHTDGRVIWSKGKDGQPHTMSPFLNGLQDSLNGRSADGDRDTFASARFDGLRDTRTGNRARTHAGGQR
jgi:hypothetical protein